jgi:hypothetical protein
VCQQLLDAAPRAAAAPVALCGLPGSGLVVSGGPAGCLCLWDTRARRLVRRVRLSAGPAGPRHATCMDWCAAGGGRLCVGLSDGAAAVYALAGRTGPLALRAVISGPGSGAARPVTCVKYGPGGRLLAVGQAGGLHVWQAHGDSDEWGGRLRGGAVGRDVAPVAVDWADDATLLRAAAEEPVRDVLFWAVDAAGGRLRAVAAAAARGAGWSSRDCGGVWETAGLLGAAGDEHMVATLHSAHVARPGPPGGAVQAVAAGRADGTLDVCSAPCGPGARGVRCETPHVGGVGRVRWVDDGVVTAGAGDAALAQWRLSVQCT